MTPPARRGLSLAFSLAILSAAPAAHALCRTTTMMSPTDSDEHGCARQGKPLFWKNACLGFSLQKTEGKQIKLADLGSSLAKAFELWTTASCSSGGHPSVEVKQLAATTVDTVEYDSKGPNVNLVVMRDDTWPHSGGDEALALTTLAFDSETGEIFDGDIEINTAQNKFALSDPIPADAFDLRLILAHQAGHFLGLGHSDDEKSPMFPSADPGEKKAATLRPDDVAGVCDVYAPSGARKTAGGAVNAAACDPTPRGGLALEPSKATSGCATTPGTSRLDLVAPALVGLVLAFLGRRRRGPPSTTETERRIRGR